MHDYTNINKTQSPETAPLAEYIKLPALVLGLGALVIGALEVISISAFPAALSFLLTTVSLAGVTLPIFPLIAAGAAILALALLSVSIALKNSHLPQEIKNKEPDLLTVESVNDNLKASSTEKGEFHIFSTGGQTEETVDLEQAPTDPITRMPISNKTLIVKDSIGQLFSADSVARWLSNVPRESGIDGFFWETKEQYITLLKSIN